MAFRYSQFFAAPDQSGDAPGYVVLMRPEENELERQNIEMVQLVNKPQWKKNAVAVKLLFDWKWQQRIQP